MNFTSHSRAVQVVKAVSLVLLTVFLAKPVCRAEAGKAGGQRKPDPWLPKYFATKEQEARWLTKELKLQVPPEIWEYFDAGSKGDWTAANKLFDGISRNWRQGKNNSAIAGPVLEAVLAYEGFTGMEMKFVEAFARDVIDSVPPGSIYFGGSDPGRGLITTFVKSLPKADPFFVLSQNPLGDRTYLEYVRAMYGKRIYIPSDEEWKMTLADYVADAEKRMKANQLKPGENLEEDENGKFRPKGNVAWTEVNALLARMIFDRNSRQEFYIEESIPMEWMYPYLSPHGLILKLNRQPLTGLSEKVVRENREYWRGQTKRLIGDRLTNETPVKVLCEFLEDVYGQGLFDGFKGDQDYVLATRGRNVQILYAHLRNGQRHVYEWRMNHAATPEEKERMLRELDFSYRQAIALFPYDVETVKRYVSLLRDQKRMDDARRMLDAGLRINPRSTRLQELADEMQ